MELLIFLLCVALIWFFLRLRKSKSLEDELLKKLALKDDLLSSKQADNEKLQSKIDGLAKYRIVKDAEDRAREISAEANEILTKAKAYSEKEKQKAQEQAKSLVADALKKFAVAELEVNEIIAAAQLRANQIAGDAYVAMSRAKEFQDAATAIKNIIEGYGDEYIAPTYSLLDDLADEFGHTDAGQKLKSSRELTRLLVQKRRAATCEYAEASRKETAIRFVTDAFNGKVDSILSRTRTSNHGKLDQEIKDAFSVVNHNGVAFRNARITDEYLAARLDELKWGAIAFALKEKEREEQRALREQMREEEKSRREFERAIRDAAKEEDALRQAMNKAQEQIAAASESQRAEFELKLSELQEKLRLAEEKNKRALSMAQQTRTGHVYVISNIGSFGQNVFKIGMTRRLEPNDRIRELGDASVPFEFDVHAMIFSEDAPGLEKSLHRHFLREQMNKVNPRKEFFKIGLKEIRDELDKLGVVANWTMKAEAEDYRASLNIEQQLLTNPNVEKEWTRYQLDASADMEQDAIYLREDTTMPPMISTNAAA
jgi:Domain of unknown function (DUF4041)/T5orf172 domain